MLGNLRPAASVSTGAQPDKPGKDGLHAAVVSGHCDAVCGGKLVQHVTVVCQRASLLVLVGAHIPPVA
jgi:hypothetical protein